LNPKQGNIYSQKPLIAGRYGEFLAKTKTNLSNQSESHAGMLAESIRRGSADFKLPRLDTNEKSTM
jgi:hypothetical protein